MIPPPLSVQGAPLKTCGAMDLLKNAADDRAILEQQPRPRQHQQQQQQPQPQEQHKSGEALEPKHIIKGVDSEVGSLTGHSDFGWAASVSEGSVSSMDSFHGGETLYSPTEYHHPSLFRKPRPGVHMSESLVLSDDEPAPDLVDQSFSKRRGASSGMEEVAPDHGSTPSEDFPCPRVKFMCSFGGKILPRPVDGTLRYVGGETRIITVPRDITYTDLMFKMTEFYGHALTLKYQLPKEELDALVSVSSDEDLENMMEEYDKIEASDQSSRLRVFLFNSAEYDMTPLSEHLGYARDSEQRYVDAVNGLLEPVVPRKQSEGASSSTAQTSAPVDNLLDVDPPWVNDHAAAIAAGAVPLARLAPAVSQDVASLIHQVPVAVPVVSAPISSYQYAPPVVVSSAPLSAPSSPPNAIRSGLVAPPAIADLFFQDPQMPSLDPLAGHLYSGKLPGEAGYQDVEAYAGTTAPSSAGGHDAQFRGVDTRRAPESPPKSHFLPRPSSYGKLADLDRGGRVDHMDGLSPFDLHRLVLQQQPWQHPVDVQSDPYRRADVPAHDTVVPTLQNAAAAAFGPPPQLQPLHFRPGLSGHDAVYWQRDQSLPQAQQQQQNEDVYAVPHFHRSISAHQLHQPGSTPSSPRLGFSNVPGWQLGGQQQQQQQPKYHRHYAHTDGQYARVVHGYGDQGSRPLAVSPPRHRDRDHFQPPPGDDRVSRQQQVPSGGVALASGPLLNSEAGPSSEQHAGTVLPSALPQSLYSEVLPRGAVPQYVVLNPYAEGLVPVHEHQDGGESRRHILAHGLEPGVAMAPQPHYLLPVQGQRAPTDSTSFHSRYADADWGTQQRVHDERLRPSGRAWVGQPNYLEDSPVLDVGGSQSAPSSYSAFLPEDADVLLAQDPFVSQHPRSKRVMDDVVHGRPASLTGGTGAGFGKGRGPFVETTQVVHQLPGRSAENELQLAASVPVVSSVAIGLPGNNQVLVDEHMAGITFNQPTARVTAAELAAVTTVAMAVPAVGVPVPLSNDAFQGGRVTVPELAAVPAVAFSRPVGVGAVSVLSDAPQAGRVALIFDERGQTVPGLRGEEVASKLAQLTVLEEGRDDSTRSVDVKLPRSGSDEALTSNYPSAGPTTHVHQAALSLGLHSSHTCSGSDRHRAQAAYKPSPLGGKGSAADEIFSKLHPLGQEGQPNHPVAGVDVSHHADINLSGAALLAEDMAASVLTSRESPVFDRSRGISATAAADKAVLPAAEPSLTSLIAPTLHAADQQVEKTEDVVNPAIDGTGTPSLARATGHVAEEPKSPPEPEESDDVLSPLEDTAAKAKREAISRGLQTINNADLEELRELGSGTFGTVYHGKWRGSDVAIKRIKASCFAGRPSEQERLRADFWREACTLSQLHHPNVVAFYGVVPDGPGGTLATVTEYMVNGSMKQVMQKKDRTIDRRKRLLIAMDAAFGMEYLHLKNIVHFDLKCENLLVNMRDPQRPVCKVGDLGLSKVKHQTMVSGGVRGTLPWMAPELLNGQAALVTDKVDVYSFGIVMWELLTGDEPYASMHYGAIIGGIVNDSLRPEIPHWCEPAWRSLMERCWSADPAERPSFSDIASELRTMSAHPKAHGHGHNPGQNQGQAQGVGQGQTQASGQVQRQVSPPRAT